jgi:hypothetical protein
MSRTIQYLGNGFKYLEKGKFKAAIKNFENAVASGDGTNLQRDVAAFYMLNTAKYRREWKKRRFGNAHLFWYDSEDNSGKAWSDVDIAAVLLTPITPKLNEYLSKFLSRNLEAIKFQRRYAYGRPLTSWVSESGKRYTRYTQTKNVQDRLGA